MYNVTIKIKKGASQKEKDMNARELAEKHGVSHTLIYNMAKKLGRLPTAEVQEYRR